MPEKNFAYHAGTLLSNPVFKRFNDGTRYFRFFLVVPRDKSQMPKPQHSGHGKKPQVDAIPHIIRASNARALQLSITYRCPKQHVELAQAIVPHLEARPSAPEGVVDYIDELQLARMLRDGDMVICRTNAPLISCALLLARQGMKVKLSALARSPTARPSSSKPPIGDPKPPENRDSHQPKAESRTPKLPTDCRTGQPILPSRLPTGGPKPPYPMSLCRLNLPGPRCSCAKSPETIRRPTSSRPCKHRPRSPTLLRAPRVIPARSGLKMRCLSANCEAGFARRLDTLRALFATGSTRL